MANSKLPGLLGLPGPYPAARTPGVLGFNDQGDPTKLTLLGDTPGPLGFNDYADPNLKRWSPGSGFNFAQSVRTDTGVALSLPVGGAAPLVDDSMGRLITNEQLSKIFEEANIDLIRNVVDELNKNLTKYCLDTVLRRAHFFAQVRQEGGPELNKMPESFKYNAAALAVPFKYYRLNPAEALLDGYIKDPNTKQITQAANEISIANKVYAGRMKNGDEISGDGWKFRGRGFMQITCRGNYRTLSQIYSHVYGGAPINFEKNPEILSTFPFSVRSAVCFWVHHKLYELADRGTEGRIVDQITDVINLYTNSRLERRSHFTTALNVFK